MPSVSVIIRCYNEAEHIGRLLSGIQQQSTKAAEIILVDSGSTDATLEIARQFPTRILSIAPTQFTFGRALNVGCEAATGDILVIASAHVYPIYRDWLEALVEPFRDETVALTYGRQQGDQRTRFSEHQVFAKWFPAKSVNHQPHPFCNNANAAIRRTLWQDFPYNESLTGLEDMDWARRIMALGHGVSYVAEAPVAHIHNERFAQVRNRYRREAIAHRQIFPEQTLSKGQALRFGLANIVSDYWHACLLGKLPGALVDIPRFRAAQFLGSLQGFEQRGPVAAALLRHFYYPNGLSPQSLISLDEHRRNREIDYEDLKERNAA